MERIKNNKLFYTFFLIICLLGIFLRLRLWFFNPGLHCDEASLALNLFDASFSDLFKPLIRLQVAPPLFLVLVKYFYRIVNLHYTPDFSDMMLRFIPLAASICAIPLFAYLVNLIFKNKFITLLAALMITISPCAISYSCIFKQYSTELLITILIIILFKTIKFNEKYKFFILGFAPFLSLNSFFIFPGCFCELLIRACKEKALKKFFTGLILFLIPFSAFVLFILFPIMRAHYTNMESYWSPTFAIAGNIGGYIKILIYYMFRIDNPSIFAGLFIISALVMLIKNFRLAFYTTIPLLITYFLTLTKHYPLSERFLLFLLPVVILTLIYPLSLLPKKVYEYKPVLNYIIIAILTIFLLYNSTPLSVTHLKQEYGKEAWKYLAQNYDGKTPVIIGEDFVTNLYYRMFYQDEINYYDMAFLGKHNAAYTLETLPAGVWYFIITRYDMIYYDFAKLLEKKVEILDYKTFELEPDSRKLTGLYIDAPSSVVMKVRKK